MSSKVGVPHFMSLNSAQDENTFKALSATDGVDAGLKRQPGELQVCLVPLTKRSWFRYIYIGSLRRTNESTQISMFFSQAICY